MDKKRLCLILSIIFFTITTALFAQDHSSYVEILNEPFEIFLNDTADVDAVYVDSSEVEHDTTLTWNVVPDRLGSIDSTGQFVAIDTGRGFIYASFDGLTDSIEVEVIPLEDEDGDDDSSKVIIKPKETEITVGTSVQFTAHFDAGDSTIKSGFTWSLEGMPVGTIDDDGFFHADSVGFALVYAHLDETIFGTAFILVVDSSASQEELNSVIITKNKGNSPNGYKTVREFTEGEVWKLNGLPHPMNFLNGGRVYFPVGSLNEDIRIHMSIPRFGGEPEDTTGFGESSVVGAVSFEVFVGDSLVEPYWFDKPLIVGLVYKRGLLETLNIDPLTVGLYFTYTEGDSVLFDSTGIDYTTIDPHRNRIYSTVEHFSTLSVRGEKYDVTSAGNVHESIPENYKLYQNYPNPFNPSTTIKYALPKEAKVKLVIYDILGKEVITILNKAIPAGHNEVIWNGNNSYGEKVSSGIYFYQLQVDNVIKTRKMILIK